MVKLAKFQGQTLRASTRLISENISDRAHERIFTITFYLEDDTLQIFEEVKANTGADGGIFLKRGKYYNELPDDCDTPRYFVATDFYLGNVFSVHKREMRIVDIDEVTLKLCESLPDMFPMSDPTAIVLKHVEEVASTRMDMRAEIMKYDRRKGGLLPKELLLHAFEDIGICHVINDQEILTLMRLAQNGDKYEYFEICDMFSQVYYTKNVGSPKVSACLSARSSARSMTGIDNTESCSQALFNLIKGNKTQFRRVLRQDSPLAGFTTLARISYLFGKAGLNLTKENKDFIKSTYRVSDREATMYLPQLNFPIEDDMKTFSSSVKSESVVPGISRLDIKSSSRVASSSNMSIDTAMSMCTPAISEIQRRRQQLQVSILKPPGSKRDYSSNAVVNTSPRDYEAEENIVISYKALCDEVYRFDWL